MVWWKKNARGDSPPPPSSHHASAPSADLDDDLKPSELVSSGGRWQGLLFDNPAIGLAPQVTWTFTFDYEEVVRPEGGSSVTIAVDWVPLPEHPWRTMKGATASCAEFAEPIESSVYFFEHHRFDEVSIAVLDQNDQRLLVETTVSGDVDGLGIPTLAAKAWLDFDGIYVQLDGCDGDEESLRALSRFTDTTSLAPVPNRFGVVRYMPEPDASPT